MRRFPLGLLLISLGCGHTEPFTLTEQGTSGPLKSDVDTRLTFNSGDDYLPTLTEDGSALLYRYSILGTSSDDRCISLLPLTGGTRLWTRCDTRMTHADSADSYIGAALGHDGRLIYMEASSHFVPATTGPSLIPPPQAMNLWLDDSAAGHTPRLLLTLPPYSDQGGGLNWIDQIAWTGATSFIAHGGGFGKGCIGTLCFYYDTLVKFPSLVRGTITASGATLQTIPESEGAPDFTFAEGGASVVWIRGGAEVWRAPVASGAGTLAYTFSFPLGGAVLDLSCDGAGCVALTRESVAQPPPPATLPPVYRLRRLNLTTMTDTIIGSATASWRQIVILPGTHDLIARISNGGTSDLHRMVGVLP